MKHKALLSALVYGVLASIPFLVPGMGWVSLFAMVPLLELAVADDVRHKGWCIFAAFFVFNLVSTFWIAWITVPGAITAIALNALQMYAILMLFIKSRRHFKGALPYLFLMAMWLAWERIYQNIEISWPWLILGNSFATSPKLVQWYEYTGFLGGSLWVLLSNILIYGLIRSWRRRDGGNLCKRRIISLSVATLLCIAVPAVVSWAIYSNYDETDNPIEVLAIQPNIDSVHEKHGGLAQTRQDSIMMAMVGREATENTRYVITPETFTYQVNLDMPEANCTIRTVTEYMQAHPGQQFVLGALAHRFFDSKLEAGQDASPLGDYWYLAYNSALMVDSEGLVNCYHKSKLVPGTEIIPYGRYIPLIGKLITLFGGGWATMGTMDDVRNLETRQGDKVGAMICYESVYGEYFRRTALYGAPFVAVITNDGWWGDTPGYRQHFRFARLRAIETRRDVVQVANTGISGFINQRGDVVSRTDWWVPTALKGNVNLNSELTFYTENGDITGRLATFIFLLLCAVWVVRAVIGTSRK
ncbi:MAG: apolipoprotein N-acyltransferase [Bacteroidales bacterium]|nr:apolipoprotein N-acyltransferase [Bacteroidales bacterium]